MELNKDQYTKEEVQEMLNRLNSQIAELTANLADATSKLESMTQLQKDNLHNSIKLELVKAGFDEGLFDLVVADDIETAKGKIAKLQDLQKQKIIDNSYKPTEHSTTDDAYSVAEKQGNVEGMIKSKLAKLFS